MSSAGEDVQNSDEQENEEDEEMNYEDTIHVRRGSMQSQLRVAHERFARQESLWQQQEKNLHKKVPI